MRLRGIVLGVGAVAALLGLIWAGQGSGWFPYPASSIMIGAPEWTWRGLAVAAAGGLVMALSRRL